MPKFGTKTALFGYIWMRILKKLLSYMKSAPSNLSICKISRKNKNVYFWDKKCLIRVYLGWNFIKLLSYLKSAPSKEKCLHLGQKVLYSGIFRMVFYKTIVIFEVSTLKFVYLQNFDKRQKCPSLGPKMLYLSTFLLEF